MAKKRKRTGSIQKTLGGVLIAFIMMFAAFSGIYCAKLYTTPYSSNIVSMFDEDTLDDVEISKEKCNILLLGTDKDGLLTDVIMLAQIDPVGGKVSVMSIPRDTHVDAPYSVPKINSAVGYGGGGKRGMEELMTRISEITGFMPDGYILVDLNDFVSVVNFMGGVNFDVPMDMDYDDPTQDLKIHLKKGEQHLNGREAIQLVRFRSGYADADLGRTSVQRDFMQAALKQWTSPLKIWRIPFLTVMVATRIRTDMSLGNLGWIGRVGLLSHTHNIQMDLLPGEPQYIGSGSYYVADESATHSLMKQSYSPYR